MLILLTFLMCKTIPQEHRVVAAVIWQRPSAWPDTLSNSISPRMAHTHG